MIEPHEEVNTPDEYSRDNVCLDGDEDGLLHKCGLQRAVTGSGHVCEFDHSAEKDAQSATQQNLARGLC